jgi:8-oxo-dGTP pyrophosphatase MutT (NUDIX family)
MPAGAPLVPIYFWQGALGRRQRLNLWSLVTRGPSIGRSEPERYRRRRGCRRRRRSVAGQNELRRHLRAIHVPGGVIDLGETIDKAAIREVAEETGVTAKPLGVCGLRSRVDGSKTDNYVLLLMMPESGIPRSNGKENDDARYFSLEELDAPEVHDLCTYVGGMALP